MDSAARWPAEGSDSVDGVERARCPARAARRSRWRYDFGGVSGYAFIRRKADVTLPRNYEIRFRMRGSGGRNDLQMKLTHGDNVWWKVWRNAAPADGMAGNRRPRRRNRLRLGSDHRQDAAPRRRDRVRRRAQPRWRARQLAIDDLRIVALPGAPTVPPPAENKRQRRPRRARQGQPARRLPARVYRRAALLDACRIGRRQGRRADRRGCARSSPPRAAIRSSRSLIDGGKRFDWANVGRAQSSRRCAGCRCPSVTGPRPAVHARPRRCSPITPGAGPMPAMHVTNRGARAAQRSSCGSAFARGRSIRPRNSCRSRAGHSPIVRIDRARRRGLRIVQPQEEGDPPVVRTLRFAGSPHGHAIGACPRSARRRHGRRRPRLSRSTLAPGETARIVAGDDRRRRRAAARSRAPRPRRWRIGARCSAG